MSDQMIMGAAVRGVVRLSKAVERVLAEEGLSVSQFRILDRLVEGSTHGRTLAEWLAVKPPSITALVDGLVKRGVVARSEDDADRRQVTHTVTPSGQRLHREMCERIAAHLVVVADHASDLNPPQDMIDSLAAWDTAFTATRDAKLNSEARA